MDKPIRTFGRINRSLKNGLIYEGDPIHLDWTVDEEDAYTRFKGKPQSIDYQQININVYGKNYTFKLPIASQQNLTPTNHETITPDMRMYLADTVKKGMLSDIILGIWQTLLTMYDVIELDITTDPSDPRKYVLFKRVYYEPKPQPDPNAVSDVNKNQNPNNEGLIIMKKEFLDGYVRLSPYIYKDGDLKQPMKISHTYHETNPDGTTTIIPHNYTTGLRKAMFANATKRVDDQISEQTKVQPLMMKRQYDVIKRMGQRTYIAGPRRLGKTFLTAFLSMREMLKESFTFQSSLRPLSVIYLGLSEKKNLRVVNYIQTMTKQMGDQDQVMFNRKSDRNLYQFKSGKDILAEISFLSAESNDPGIGDYADLIIIDEAPKIPEKIMEGLSPLVTHEGAKLIAIGTMYKDSNKGRFFQRLTEAESKMPTARYNIDSRINEQYEKFTNLIKKDIRTNEDKQQYLRQIEQYDFDVGLRYTVDDIDYLTPQKIQAIKDKDEYKLDKQRYFSELYSRFPDEGKVFNYESTLTDPQKILQPLYKYVSIGYDHALTADKAGLTVVGYDDSKNKIAILEAHYLIKDGQYQTQVEQIQKIMKQSQRYLHTNNNPIESNSMNQNIYLTIDGSQKPIAELLEIKGLPVHLRVAYTGGSQISTTKILNEQKVPKDMLVEISQNVFENNRIQINLDLRDLLNELDSFQKINTESGAMTYEAIKGTDDLVNAMMLSIYYLYNILGLKYEILQHKNTVADQKKITPRDYGKRNQIKYMERMVKGKQDILQKARDDYYRNNVY